MREETSVTVMVERANPLPFDREEAVEYARASEGDEDLVETCMLAAVEYVEQKTSRVLVPTTFRTYFSEWSCDGRMVLPRSPLREVLEVAYADENGDDQVVATGSWHSERDEFDGGVVLLPPSFSAPRVSCERTRPISVEFSAGYDIASETGSGEDPELVLPSQIKIAVLMLTQHWYDNRGVVQIENKSTIGTALSSILDTVKVWR